MAISPGARNSINFTPKTLDFSSPIAKEMKNIIFQYHIYTQDKTLEKIVYGNI